MRYSIEQFLDIRTASFGGFSKDGTKVLIHTNLTGTSQVYRLPRTGGELTQLTSFPEPCAGSYLPTSDQILLGMDEGGNERMQLSLMDDDGSNVQPFVHDPEHINSPGGFTRDGTTFAYTSNRRNGVDFDVYIRDLASGAERIVFDRGGWCSASGFSPDGRYLGVGQLTERNSDNERYLVDVASGEIIHVSPHGDEAQFGGPAWLPDSSAFYFATDSETEFRHICRYDMADGTWKPVISRDHDLGCSIDWVGRALRVSANVDGLSHIELFDPRTLSPMGELPLPGQGIAGTSASKDGRFIGLTFLSASRPGDAWVHDLDTGGTTRLTHSPNPVPEDVFVEPTLHRIRSFDGEQIPAFLFMPTAPERTPVPVIVYIHGGPESQFVPGFNPVIQYLVHAGYAVLAPNVRGSTGYGKRFHHLDDVRKRLDSVRDLEALHGWLRDDARCDHTRAALMGGSYGGYMVLAGLTFQPQLWAAGVDIVGISSLVTFLENTSAYRRKFREREYGSLEHDRDFLLEASPITHIDKLRAPLLIIHGSNDPRVPLGEAEQIHGVLQGKGVASELLVYPDEGHGLAKLRNRLDAYPKVVSFLDRVLA
jgi:dipeptidyl aminopeptidase/acylaminoacyl peptidase